MGGACSAHERDEKCELELVNSLTIISGMQVKLDCLATNYQALIFVSPD